MKCLVWVDFLVRCNKMFCWHVGMILGAAALGMGAGMIGVPFIQPGMSDVGGTMGGFDMTDML